MKPALDTLGGRNMPAFQLHADFPDNKKMALPKRQGASIPTRYDFQILRASSLGCFVGWTWRQGGIILARNSDTEARFLCVVFAFYAFGWCRGSLVDPTDRHLDEFMGRNERGILGYSVGQELFKCI
jgi:hypothetical protein